MSPDQTGRLVILSGPACVGKSPLGNSLGKFYPELNAQLQDCTGKPAHSTAGRSGRSRLSLPDAGPGGYAAAGPAVRRAGGAG
jgi:hypothetical protein